MLNQNVRYQGGATRPGAVDEVVARLQHAGVGIVQMPCPEQRAWGGADKRYTMPAYGADHTTLRRLRRPATWLFPGGNPGQPLSVSHVRRVCKRAVRACGLCKKASMHTLREVLS